jgi:hypothetical protein
MRVLKNQECRKELLDSRRWNKLIILLILISLDDKLISEHPEVNLMIKLTAPKFHARYFARDNFNYMFPEKADIYCMRSKARGQDRQGLAVDK